MYALLLSKVLPSRLGLGIVTRRICVAGNSSGEIAGRHISTIFRWRICNVYAWNEDRQIY